MPVTVVVGGQFGSEGKGKVAALVSLQASRAFAVRCGGPNSGHTTEVQGRRVVLRQLPSAAGHAGALLGLAAGCVVDEQVLLEEISACAIPRERVVVDPRAILIHESDREAERELRIRIGSTASGNGNALARRIKRASDAELVGDAKRLLKHVRVEPLAPLLHDAIDRREKVVVEGTQGFGLSLLHSKHFPNVTSKDTTAASFASEVGISPRDIDEIILVIRTYPIRVSGNSGPLSGEVTWEEIKDESGAPAVEPEFTSVTRGLRRVGRFDLEAVLDACRYNKPTSIALMGVDRLNFLNRLALSERLLTSDAALFIDRLESHTGVPVSWVGTGFDLHDAFGRTRTDAEVEFHA